jgi:hypothetical protein
MKPGSSVYITDRKKNLLINLSKPDKKSQSALEYMMTYGWAILIIVIVAAVLYSLGIFNPSSSISFAATTGFQGYDVSAFCTSAGALVLNVLNPQSTTINVTAVSATFDGATTNATMAKNFVLLPQQSASVAVYNSCPSSVGARFSDNVAVYYKPIGSFFNNPSVLTGVVSGSVSGQSSSLPNIVGGIAVGGDSAGDCSTGIPSGGDYYGIYTRVGTPASPVNGLYNGTYAINTAEGYPYDGWEVYGTMSFSDNVTFYTAVDDQTEFFYKPVSSNTWSGAVGYFEGAGIQVPKSISVTPGLYNFSFNIITDHTCDNVFWVIKGAFPEGNLHVSVWTPASAPVTYASTLTNPETPGNARVYATATWPSSYYYYTAS